MPLEASSIQPQRWIAATLTLLAGVGLLVSWYQPWFSLHFATGSTLSESPTLAAQDPAVHSALPLLVVSAALTLVGALLFIWRPAVATAVQTALIFGLVLATVPLLGDMAVFTVWSGHANEAVTLVPEWGSLLALLSFAAGVTGAVLLWRDLRMAHQQ
jgi:hypothetical protein